MTLSGEMRTMIQSMECGLRNLHVHLEAVGLMHNKAMAQLSDVSAYGSKQRYLLRECFWLIVITEEWTSDRGILIDHHNLVDT